MALASSGRLLYVNNFNLFWQVLEGSGRAPEVSGRLWLVLKGFRKFWWSVLDGSGRVWEAREGLWVGPGKALERIWKALDGFDRFGRGLDSSGWLWPPLDGFST